MDHRQMAALTGLSNRRYHSAYIILILLVCVLFRLGDLIADSRINTPVDFHMNCRHGNYMIHLFFHTYCSCRQRRQTRRRPNWVKNFACLRRTQWFSFRSRFSRNILWRFYETAPFWWELFLIFDSPRNTIPSNRQPTKRFPPTNQLYHPTAFNLTIPTRITWCWYSSNKIHHTVLIKNFLVSWKICFQFW